MAPTLDETPTEVEVDIDEQPALDNPEIEVQHPETAAEEETE